MWVPLAAAAIQAAGSVASGMMANQQPEPQKIHETKTERTRRKLLDELIGSLRTGEGKYGDLFSMDDEAFQKAYVDPAQSRFKNQIAPAIQQKFIGSGDYGGNALNDSLLRAGVDMDMLLNEQYGNFRDNALNRKTNLLQSALGSNTGQPTTSGGGYSSGQAAQIGASSYLGSEGFSKSIDKVLESYNKPKTPERKGFESIE